MTWGHCDSCRWRWVPWAGPCVHVPPKEGEECIGFSPVKQHRRPETREGDGHTPASALLDAYLTTLRAGFV